MQNQNNNLFKSLLALSVVLAVVAIYVGQTYFPHENGGPARLIGLVAFICFIISLIFRQRAKQVQRGQLITSGKTYAKNSILVMALLPAYFIILFLLWWMSWGLNLSFPFIIGLLLFPGLVAIIFRNK
jgi:hypothetical protein